MFYEAKLSRPECELLASLVGHPLDRVTTDGWGVDLRSGVSILRVIPEEVATPDAEHPHGDVDRPTVRTTDEPIRSEHAIVVAEGLGLIREANVISTLISFSSVMDCPPEEIAPGVVVPQGTAYGYIYHSPDERQQSEEEVGAGALVDLDIAFELITERYPSLVVFTRLYFVLVSSSGMPNDEEWVALGAFQRRSVR